MWIAGSSRAMTRDSIECVTALAVIPLLASAARPTAPIALDSWSRIREARALCRVGSDAECAHGPGDRPLAWSVLELKIHYPESAPSGFANQRMERVATCGGYDRRRVPHRRRGVDLCYKRALRGLRTGASSSRIGGGTRRSDVPFLFGLAAAQRGRLVCAPCCGRSPYGGSGLAAKSRPGAVATGPAGSNLGAVQQLTPAAATTPRTALGAATMCSNRVPWNRRAAGRRRRFFVPCPSRVPPLSAPEDIPNSLKSLARPAGLEPATYGLEVRCSIQLS